MQTVVGQADCTTNGKTKLEVFEGVFPLQELHKLIQMGRVLQNGRQTWKQGLSN